MTTKEKYQDIDLSKLPEKAVERVKAYADYYEKDKPYIDEENKAKGEQGFSQLYDLISQKYPESIKSKQAKAPEPKTPQAVAKQVAQKSVKQPSKGKSSASTKPTKRGEISRLAKEIRKEGERFQDAMKRAGEMIQAEKKKAVTNANKQYKKLEAFLKKNPIPAGSTTISRDAPRKALPAGKRTSKSGNTYYEYRQNRTDKSRKRYPYLALGGKLHGAGMFEDGGMYAKGGVTEVSNYHKNILGTLSFNLKLPNMRKTQDFNVYPLPEKSNIITIQSDTRIGQIDMTTGKGLMSQSYPNGAYFVHYQMDMMRKQLVAFKLDDAQLAELKKELAKTAGKSVGSNIMTTDNSFADKFAKGGKVSSKFQEIEDIGDTQFYSRYFGKVYTYDKKDKEVVVNLLVVATISDLEDAVPQEDLPAEGNFELTFTLVPEIKFMSKELLEDANSENLSVGENDIVNIVNYMGGLRFGPADKIFFKTQEAAEKFLMSKELNDQITAMGYMSGFSMDKAYNRIGQTNWDRLQYMMGVTDKFAKGGETQTHLDELYKKANHNIFGALELYAGELGIYNMYFGHKVDANQKKKFDNAQKYLMNKYRFDPTYAKGGKVSDDAKIGEKVAFENWQLVQMTTDLKEATDKCDKVREQGFAAIVAEDLVAGKKQYFVLYKQYSNTGYEGERVYAKGGKTSLSDLERTVVYDNNGKTFDRYTIFTPDGSVYAMSENALGFNLYIGDKTEIPKGKHLGKRLSAVPENIKAAVLERLNQDTFAKGGSIGKFKIQLDSWYADVFEDDYEQGESIVSVNSFNSIENKPFNSAKDFFEYLNSRVFYTDLSPEDFVVMEAGRLSTSVLCDENNYPASESEIERWKRGEQKLYSVNYDIFISFVDKKTPTEDELSTVLGVAKYKKGGKIGDTASVRSWYMKTYPTDDMGADINKARTFKSLWAAMHKGIDIYDYLGVGDSVIRERVFEQLAELYGVTYDEVYDLWGESQKRYAEGGELDMDKYNGAGMFAKGGEVKPIDTNFDGIEFSKTYIYKGYYGWIAETFTKDKINGYDWKITTLKRYSGNLLSDATAGTYMPSTGGGFSGFSYAPFQDPSVTLEQARPKMVTEKAVREQHIAALKKFAEMANAGQLGGQYAKGGQMPENFGHTGIVEVKPYHASREDVAELIDWLDNNNWDFKRASTNLSRQRNEQPYIQINTERVSDVDLLDLYNYLNRQSWDWVNLYAKGGEFGDAVNSLWIGYAEAILFTETDLDTDEPLENNYSVEDFDDSTISESKKMLHKYYLQNMDAIHKSGLDLQTIGNDIWYTRAGHGVGFFDHNLDDEIEKKLTKSAKMLGEYPTVETYEGKISIRGGRVFNDYAKGGGVQYADGGKATRPLYEIAREIRMDWKNVYFGAKPYLDAMSSLSDITDNYGMDSARSIVNYFLANAGGWRGDKAKSIKAELKSMAKYAKGGKLTGVMANNLRKRFEGYTDEELQIFNGDNEETLRNWNREDAIEEAIELVLIESGEYAKGGSISKSTTYIPNRNIVSLKAKLENRSVNLKGSDLIDGVYVKNNKQFAKGGELNNLMPQSKTHRSNEK